MNWDDPVARLRLVEQVGHEEYNRRMREHQQSLVMEVRNGYQLAPVNTRFGRLVQVRGANKAYATIEQARDYADSLPVGTASI